MKYYPTTVSEFSDAELVSLAKEIEDSGLLEHCDHFTWEEDSWEQQAYDRWFQLRRELDQRNPRTGEIGSSLAELNKITAQYLASSEAMERIFSSSDIFERMKRS